MATRQLPKLPQQPLVSKVTYHQYLPLLHSLSTFHKNSEPLKTLTMASSNQDLPYIPQCELFDEPNQAQSTQLQPPIISSSMSASSANRSGGSSTPNARTSTPSGGNNSRVRLSEEEKVKLVRLCILHQADHRYGNKKVFWTKIRELLKEEIGKELRDLQQALNSLVTQFEVQVKKEEKESGRYNSR